MYGHWLHHNHCRTTHGPLEIISEMLIPGQTIHRHISCMCAKDDPVLQRLVTQLHRE